MSSSVVLQPEYIPHSGGFSAQQRQGHAATWKGIGVLYVRENAGVIEFRVLYESHVSEAVKNAIAERFGVGSIEWKVCS